MKRLLHKASIEFRIVVILFLVFITNSAKADEGMWLISLISNNISEMQRMGLTLSADDIYNVNKSSLKDAAVLLDDGTCSAEIISSKGLMLTNHHCAISDIQLLSTLSQNFIRDGFWAKNLKEELQVPGKSALILKRVEDITDEILASIGSDYNSTTFFERVDLAMKQIKSNTEAKEKGSFVRITPLYHNNQFFLFVYNRYTDIRLVGVPPASIGNFGGDVDNWHWPRHTGDFTLYRIYTAPDGSPADFSKKNVPLKPKHHYPVSLKGLKEGDFTMVIGYPGQTFRFSTSFQAIQNRDVVAPWVDEYWGQFIRILKDGMKSNPETKIHYTDTHDGLVNYWQKDVWQSQSMKRFGVVEQFRQREDSLIAWAKRDSISRFQFIEAIPKINSYYQQAQEKHYDELLRSLTALTSWPISINKYFYEVYDLFQLLNTEKPSKRKIRIEAKRVKKRLNKSYQGFDSNVDMQLFGSALTSVVRYLPNNYNDDLLNRLKTNDNRELLIPLLVKHFYSKSYFSSPQALKRFLKKPRLDSLVNDPLFALNLSLEMLHKTIQDSISSHLPDYKFAMRTFTKGMLEMETDKLHYPDANSTLRLSYGMVKGYYPNDGIYFRPFTFIEGLIEKDDPSEDLFSVPSKIKQLWKSRDFGIYADSLGAMPICFITNNDITNGNSGSPVLNANGHIVGVAFDGNYEAMANDFAYESSMQRTIVCDIRYVLFIIDKYAGAKHLVDEMTIIR
jgi:hypothetical protein